jgi:hypothetical protein
MSIVSVKDFGDALNISGGTIRSKISRKQLCCNKKGFIDTENPKNYIYLLEVNGGDQSVFEQYHQGVISKSKVVKKTTLPNKSLINVTSVEDKVVVGGKSNVITQRSKKNNTNEINGSVNIVPTVETKIIPEKKVPEKLSIEEKRILSEQKKANALLLTFEVRKKEAEVKLVERNAELKQYELEKKAGNTLPLDMIENVISINYKAVFKSVHSQIKNIAMVMVQQLGGSKEDLNSIMIEMENLLDTTVKDSKKKAKVDIDKLIDEYSEVRSRGERKV